MTPDDVIDVVLVSLLLTLNIFLHLRCSGVFIVNFEHIFTPSSSAFIVDFEQAMFQVF